MSCSDDAAFSDSVTYWICENYCPKNSKIYEIGVNYHGRTYKEGKKIRYYDVFSVIYWIITTKVKKGESPGHNTKACIPELRAI